MLRADVSEKGSRIIRFMDILQRNLPIDIIRVYSLAAGFARQTLV